MSVLDISLLISAVDQLEKGLKQADEAPSDELRRDGVIQRFEYCYELSLKMMKRSLEVQFSENVDGMVFKDILRTAAEHQLISDASKWFDFREERNKTSHAYDENIAAAVFETAKLFLPEVRFFLTKLEQANH